MRIMHIIKILAILMVIILIVACKKEEAYQYQLMSNDLYAFNEALSIESIDEGVIVVNHKFPWDANSLILEMKNSDIILVDTPYTYDATKELVEWIYTQVGNDRNIIAINTGYHFDNLGGNGYLKEQGIKIYGTSQTVNLIHERGEKARDLFLEWLKAPNYKKYHDVYQKLEYTEPTEIFSLGIDEEITLDFGEESLIMYYPGETHAPDNLVVYYPEKRILFGGCMIKAFNSKDLGNTADANLNEWLICMNKLVEKYSDEHVISVIPGHGEVGGIELFDKTIELLK